MAANPTAPANRPLAWRTGFDDVAEEYDAVRPAYPPALISAVIGQVQLPTPARILEIGVGTGQATLPFAQRGDLIVGLDIGPQMLRIARRNLAKYSNVELHLGAFEEWPTPDHQFDMVLAASAFHWIQPELGLAKVARLLTSSGAFVLLGNEHLAFSPGFVEDLYRIDQTIVPDWPDPRTAPDPNTTDTAAATQIADSGLFGPVVTLRVPWHATYQTAAYLRLLNTYSNYRHLPADTRDQLFKAISAVIDEKYGGRLVKSYVAIAHIARPEGTTVG